VRGISSWATHLPFGRLDRSEIAAVAGGGGGAGSRAVASYDEDAVTMGVEAARLALAAGPVDRADIASLWFSTVDAPYLDKSTASIAHAALRLRRSAPAYDVHGAARSALGALRAAWSSTGPSLVAVADLRTGRPGSEDEATGGDGGASVVVGDDPAAPIVAWGSSTDELQDRWRAPGDGYSARWEERFAIPVYTDLARCAWADAGVEIDDLDVVVVTGLHTKAVAAVTKKLGVRPEQQIDDLARTIGNTGAAHPFVLLSSVLDTAAPGQRIAVVVLADGADVIVLEVTDAVRVRRPQRSVADQLAASRPIPYGKFLAWRGMLDPEPPNRPLPARPSSSAAHRNSEWKYGFVGSAASDGRVHLPPSPDDDEPRPMADAIGTVVTYTVDRLAYSPSPPVVFAVVDFDGGGRLPVELTDAEADDVQIGSRVEMTFRRLFTGEGIHNYFWKARLQR
jgi:3-hydroxy-3-methylglutaryl CoA synthase/uncharacterized OB-fold protein